MWTIRFDICWFLSFSILEPNCIPVKPVYGPKNYIVVFNLIKLHHFPFGCSHFSMGWKSPIRGFAFDFKFKDAAWKKCALNQISDNRIKTDIVIKMFDWNTFGRPNIQHGTNEPEEANMIQSMRACLCAKNFFSYFAFIYKLFNKWLDLFSVQSTKFFTSFTQIFFVSSFFRLDLCRTDLNRRLKNDCHESILNLLV